MKKLICLAPLFLLAACASGPYAIIDGSRSDITDANSHDVMITGIDGQMYFEGLEIRNVAPGPHYLQLASTRLSHRGAPTYETLVLDAKPCTRYLVAAKHDTTLEFDNRDWVAHVIRTEPIAGCKVDEKDAAASLASR